MRTKHSTTTQSSISSQNTLCDRPLVVILDENIIDGQRLFLEARGIRVRQIGSEVGRKGLKDDALIVLLHRLRQPRFVTRDLEFYTAELRHPRYAIVVAAVGQYEVGAFVRRLLRHKTFDTSAKRMGRIIRMSPSGIAWWQPSRQGSALQNGRMP